MTNETITMWVDGIEYPVKNFRIEFKRNLQEYYVIGDPMVHIYDPSEPIVHEWDKYPRRYDICNCGHYRNDHEKGYGKCETEDWIESYDGEYPIGCDQSCEEFKHVQGKSLS